MIQKNQTPFNLQLTVGNILSTSQLATPHFWKVNYMKNFPIQLYALESCWAEGRKECNYIWFSTFSKQVRRYNYCMDYIYQESIN